jgi:spoIIIJ-associated protein
MEWVETTGRTIAEALDAALDELGVHEDDVEYEVLAEPRGGLLGRFGGSEARIRARVRPVSREKPGERSRRPRRNGSDRSRGGGQPQRQSATAAPRQERSPGSRSGGGRRGGRGQGGRAQARPVTSEGAPVNGDLHGGSDVPIEEQAQAAQAFASGLVEAFALGGRADTVIDGEEHILVDITGEDLGLLVGPKGSTLAAIEELVRTVVQRQTDGHGVRINVDVGGYRAKRREALAQFTRQLAERVLETGRAQALEPMSGSDRKVVHDVAAEIDGIATESEGEEPRRRVVLRRS